MDTSKTILIAEPTDTLSSGLRAFLSDDMFSTIRIKTLKETLLTLQSQSVDVLVLDAVLLKEDCDFISIIRVLLRICASLSVRKPIPLNLKARSGSKEYFIII